LLNKAADFQLLDELIGFMGCNVTAPFKADMADLAEKKSVEVKETGITNTLVKATSGKWLTFNTDIFGAVKPFRDRWETLQKKRILVIGAGGAARAAIVGLKQQGATVSVVNRTDEKARELAERFDIGFQLFDQVGEAIRKFDAVVNTVHVVVPPLEHYSPKKEQLLLDASYRFSPFKNYFPAGDPRYINGTEWLVAQAEQAFLHFTGTAPGTGQFLDSFPDHRDKKKGRIAIIGPMGAGKTAVGRKLSELTGFSFVDTDAEIEAREKMSISALFEQKGENHFRKLEAECLDRLSREENKVISCGGGIVLNSENRRILRDMHTVLIMVAPDTTVRRASNGNRPLLAGDDPLFKARTLLFSRLENYLRCAHVVVNGEAGPADQVAALIHRDYTNLGF
jgi:shikimate kinase